MTSSTNNELNVDDGMPSVEKEHQESTRDMNTSHVSFGTVTITSYDMDLGDNPGVTDGPPIALSDKIHGTEHFATPTDHFQAVHPQVNPQHYTLAKRIPRKEREEIVSFRHDRKLLMLSEPRLIFVCHGIDGPRKILIWQD
jgi:hypothetical protein